MAEWLRRLTLDQKVRGSIPGSNQLRSCLSGCLNSHIQTHEAYFYCLLPRLSDETLNRGPNHLAR